MPDYAPIIWQVGWGEIIPLDAGSRLSPHTTLPTVKRLRIWRRLFISWRGFLDPKFWLSRLLSQRNLTIRTPLMGIELIHYSLRMAISAAFQKSRIEIACLHVKFIEHRFQIDIQKRYKIGEIAER